MPCLFAQPAGDEAFLRLLKRYADVCIVTRSYRTIQATKTWFTENPSHDWHPSEEKCCNPVLISIDLHTCVGPLLGAGSPAGCGLRNWRYRIPPPLWHRLCKPTVVRWPTRWADRFLPSVPFSSALQYDAYLELLLWRVACYPL